MRAAPGAEPHSRRGLGLGTGRLCDPDGAASGDGPGRLDLGVIRRIRPVNLEYAGTTAARLFALS